MDPIQEAFGHIFEPDLIAEIIESAIVKSFEAGEIIVDIGQTIKFTPLLLKGAIRVVREDKNEGELLLYYLSKGETCSMSVSCCMGHKKSEIRAQAENLATVALIPTEKFMQWMDKYATWRNFILESYSSRLNEMLSAIDSLAFMNMENRVMSYLKSKMSMSQDRILTVTHQQIASDLNSSRVVISRILKKLENDDQIVLLRNEIRILV